MLCLLALLGALPPSSKYSKLKVFSKLCGKYLGVVDKPSFQDGDQFSDYQVIRYLQDQIAVFYKHARRPARYLVVFVEGVRLTCQGFYFTSQESYKQSCATSTGHLEHASRVDVMYDEDDEFALQTLRYRGFWFYFANNTARGGRRGGGAHAFATRNAGSRVSQRHKAETKVHRTRVGASKLV